MNNKTIASLTIAVLMGAGIGYASENRASSEPAGLSYAAIASASALSLLAFSAPTPAPEAVVVETELAPAAVNPLTGLDLVPAAETTTFAPATLKYNSLGSMEYGQRYLIRDLRTSATGDALFTANLLTSVALNVADYFSTSACLKHPGLQEANPLMKPFTKSPIAFAAAKIGITALSYVAMKSLYKKSKPLAWVVATASNLFLSYVVSSNIRLNKMAR